MDLKNKVSLGAAWMPIVGWIFVLAIVAILTSLIIKKNKELAAEYALGDVKKKETFVQRAHYHIFRGYIVGGVCL